MSGSIPCHSGLDRNRRRASARSAGSFFSHSAKVLRFRAGLTYELSFLKKGYVTSTRRLRVVEGKPSQKLAVALKKKPTVKAPVKTPVKKKRSSFLRW